MSKRIDQLTAHPQSTSSPLGGNASSREHVLLPVRDDTLTSDNTRKIQLNDAAPFPFVSVVNFGAIGDGVTDCTDAFQAAIDHASQASVYVPKGSYVITTVRLAQGVSLIGDGIGEGGTYIIQPDGVNDDAFWTGNESGDGYCHYTRLMNFTLTKGDGLGAYANGITDRTGNGIAFYNFCGEGTKFQNLRVQGFPGHGILIQGGAIPCWFQDLHLFLNGISPDSGLVGGGPGYGLYIDATGPFTGHYMLGISGDGNAPALIGAKAANIWASGIKAEKSAFQYYAVELSGATGNPHNWAILNGVTCSGTGAASNYPHAIVNITSTGGSGYQVWLQGTNLHTGAPAPLHAILDATQTPTASVAYTTNHMLTVYNSYVGPVMNVTGDGAWMQIGEDPPAITGTTTFGIGHTNGVGLGASTAITALAQSASSTSPASLVVSKWVKCQLDGNRVWLPVFT